MCLCVRVRAWTPRVLVLAVTRSIYILHGDAKYLHFIVRSGFSCFITVLFFLHIHTNIHKQLYSKCARDLSYARQMDISIASTLFSEARCSCDTISVSPPRPPPCRPRRALPCLVPASGVEVEESTLNPPNPRSPRLCFSPRSSPLSPVVDMRCLVGVPLSTKRCNR